MRRRSFLIAAIGGLLAAASGLARAARFGLKPITRDGRIQGIGWFRCRSRMQLDVASFRAAIELEVERQHRMIAAEIERKLAERNA